MRRVYYAFFLRLGTHPLAVHGAGLALCLFALSRVVSIPDVLANLMEVKVGEVAHYLIGALINTQLITVVLLSLIVLNFGSLLWRLIKNSAWSVRHTSLA